MKTIEEKTANQVRVITLCRGKVNALTDEIVDEIRQALFRGQNDPSITAVMLTGKGNFFSFGFDVPEFLSFSRDAFTRYLKSFTKLLTQIYLYPKPVVAALNGHTMAGGCMLALACDKRVMVTGRAKISLNEITFGSSVLLGSTEMLRACVGHASAMEILYSGDMYSAEQAKALGLVDEVAEAASLQGVAGQMATELGAKPPAAFASIKRQLRKPVTDAYEDKEDAIIKEFVDIWYSESTWENLKKITIR